MDDIDFFYPSGQLVCQGDVVAAGGKQAIVDRIFVQRTQDAKDFSCFETGGLLLAFDDGDLQLWPFINEDLELIRRASHEELSRRKNENQ